MAFIRFSVYGKRVDMTRTATGWQAFAIDADGTRAPAGFEIPGFSAEAELVQHLEDLFHASAMPWNGNVQRLP